METTTDADGKYVFKNIFQTYYTNNGQKVDIPYAVKAKMDGYKDVNQIVNNGKGIMYGQKIPVETILLEPKALIVGKIIDQQTGVGVRCNVTVVGGTTTHSSVPILVSSNKPENNSDIQQTDIVQIQNLSSSIAGVSNKSGNSNVYRVQPVSLSTTFSATESKAKPAMSAKTQMNFQLGPSYFSLPAPSGTQRIIVDPDEHTKYFTDTLEVNLKDGLNAMTITAIPKIHRIKLFVTEAKPSGYYTSLYHLSKTTSKPIYKAKVKVVGRTDYTLTNESGWVKLEFEGSDNFDIEVLPPDDADYESNSKTFSNIAATRNFQDATIQLKKASRISGKVTANDQPIEGARVKLNYSGKDIETSTGADGRYTLKSVPLGKNLVVQATKENFIGDTAVITLTTEYKDSVNLKLTAFGTMEYSRMLGFPIEVTSETTENGKTYITGEFVNLPRNGQVETSDDKKTLSFTHLEVSPGATKGSGGLPYPVPAGEKVKTDENTVELKINNTFTGLLEDKTNGITIDKGSDNNSGFIKGLLALNTDQSFVTNALSFGQEKVFVTGAGSNGTP
jgi:hypothetical protein